MKPTVLPLSEDGRGAGWEWAGLISLVGSSTRNIICQNSCSFCGPVQLNFRADSGQVEALATHRRRRRACPNRLDYVCSRPEKSGLSGQARRRRTPLALGWLAIDAGPDRCRYRLGLAAHPRRNDRAEATGRASRSHDQEMIRRPQRGVDTLAAVAHDRALADVGPFAAAHAGALVQELCDVSLGPARALDGIAQLFRDHDRVVAAIDRVVALVRPHFRSERLQNLPRVRSPLVHDLSRRHGRHDGDGGDALREATDDGQRRPYGALLILGQAI